MKNEMPHNHFWNIGVPVGLALLAFNLMWGMVRYLSGGGGEDDPVMALAALSLLAVCVLFKALCRWAHEDGAE